MKQFKPFGNYIITKKSEDMTKTESGIILSGTAKVKSKLSTVVAVGPGTNNNKMYIKVGDEVICKNNVGTEITIDKVDYVIYEQDDVIVIVTELPDEQKDSI